MLLFFLYLVAVLGMPGGITQAVIRSLSSSIVEPDEQGRISNDMLKLAHLTLADLKLCNYQFFMRKN